MTHQEAIAKAVKLLRLAQSSNPHEAALAASRAQEIMDIHKLEGLSADFEAGRASQEPISDFKADLMDAVSTQLDTWRIRLASAVAKANECRIYLSGYPKRGFAIVGRASDAVTVRLFYAWLKGQVDDLAAKECSGYGRTYWNNWRIGCVETVSMRLQDQRRKTAAALLDEAKTADLNAGGGNLALVRVERSLALREKQAAEVSAWIESNLKLGTAPSRSFRSNFSAREAGRAAGHRINLAAPQRALASA